LWTEHCALFNCPAEVPNNVQELLACPMHHTLLLMRTICRGQFLTGCGRHQTQTDK
jgi:hypothetical protein